MSTQDLTTGFPEIDGTMSIEDFVSACGSIASRKFQDIATKSRKELARTGWNLERVDDGLLWTIIIEVNPNDSEDFFGISKDKLCCRKKISMMTPTEIIYAVRDVWHANNSTQLLWDVGRSKVTKVFYIAVTRGGHSPIFSVTYDMNGNLDCTNITDSIEDEIGNDAIMDSIKYPVLERYINYIKVGSFTVQDVIDEYNNAKSSFSLLDQIFGDHFGGSGEDCDDNNDDDDDGDENNCETCKSRDVCPAHNHGTNVQEESDNNQDKDEDQAKMTDEQGWLFRKKGKGEYFSYMYIAPCLFVSKEMTAVIIVPTYDQMCSMWADNSFAAGSYTALLTSWCKNHGYQYQMVADLSEDIIGNNKNILDFAKIYGVINTEDVIGAAPTEEEWKRIFGEEQ